MALARGHRAWCQARTPSSPPQGFTRLLFEPGPHRMPRASLPVGAPPSASLPTGPASGLQAILSPPLKSSPFPPCAEPGSLPFGIWRVDL